MTQHFNKIKKDNLKIQFKSCKSESKRNYCITIRKIQHTIYLKATFFLLHGAIVQRNEMHKLKFLNKQCIFKTKLSYSKSFDYLHCILISKDTVHNIFWMSCQCICFCNLFQCLTLY